MSELREQLIGIISLQVIFLIGWGGLTAFSSVFWSREATQFFVATLIIGVSAIWCFGYFEGKKAFVGNGGDTVTFLLGLCFAIALAIGFAVLLTSVILSGNVTLPSWMHR